GHRIGHRLPRRFLRFQPPVTTGKNRAPDFHNFYLASSPADSLSSAFHMIQRDYLIIGSGIGGGSACESIRKYDKRGSVTLVGAETYHPYKRWMLSKSFLRDKTSPLKKLPHLDPRWYESHKIE